MGLIYKLTSPSQGVYIGQTSRSFSKRWSEHKLCAITPSDSHYNTILSQAIRKYGAQNFITEIIEEQIPDKNLDDREIYWIKFFNSYRGNNPRGYNMTQGGKGAVKYATNLFLDLWKQDKSIAEIIKITGISQPTISARLQNAGISQEEIIERGIIKMGQLHTRTIIQYDLEGNFIKEWTSIKEAAQYYNLCQSNDILHCCKRKNNRYTAVNSLWKYSDDNITVEELVEYYRTNRSKYLKCIPIVQYDLNDNLIQEWESAKAASLALHIDDSTIRKVCNGKLKTYKGFIWKNKELVND